MKKLNKIFFWIILFLSFLIIPGCQIQESIKHDLFTYQAINFKENSFDVIKIPKENIDEIEFYFRNEDGSRLENFKYLEEYLSGKNEKLLFAMNAGIFSLTGNPEGLYIEKGESITSLNTKDGYGNFYLKPNGVFWISADTAGITETTKFEPNNEIIYANQSGPLLLEDGNIHPAFNQNSENRFIRNGVGVGSDGSIFFVISNKEVTFYELSAFFKDRLESKDALYLDGFISQMYVAGERDDKGERFSVMIGISNPLLK